MVKHKLGLKISTLLKKTLSPITLSPSTLYKISPPHNKKPPHIHKNIRKRITFFLTNIGRPFYYLFVGTLTLTRQTLLLTQKIALLKISLPHIYLPKINISLPHFSFPKINLPSPQLRLRWKILIIPILITGFYLWILKDLPSPHQLKTLQPKLTTQIFDRHGSLLYKIYKDEKRTLVNLSDIPLHLQQATISIEDQDFYQHQGFSVSGIARALQRNLTTSRLEGGSTITQQLIKNTLLTSERTLTRKIKEVVLAIHTEFLFDKDAILQMYFNQVGYGGPAYGVQEAAQQYFGKNVFDLTLAESALIAGLPKAPTKYSPFGANPGLAKQRQLQVLSRMVQDDYISQTQADLAASENLNFASPQTNIKAPHFVMYVRDLLVKQFGEELVNSGGLQVHTTLDLNTQELAQKILTQELNKIKRLNVNNGAVLITEPTTGQILTMIGSKNYFDVDNDGQVNLTTALRQPGSAIKPINYALAFEKGYTPASLINDSPITFNLPGSPPYSPRNYDNKFHGKVSLRTALASSYNIPAIKLLAANGINQMALLAQNMGITTWNDPTRFGLSLTLGSNEVRMVDLAEAYGTFANLGTHVRLNPILSITNSAGKEIAFSPCGILTTSNPLTAATAEACPPTQVITPETAFLISDILADNSARSPAFGFRSILNLTNQNQQIAVKTGTSNDLRDNWTIGYTPDLLVAVWVGNNDNSPMSRIASGITGASPIWANTMKQILKNKSPQTFTPPNTIVKVPICNLTGGLTCPYCPSSRVETFAKGTEPTTACTEPQIKNILAQLEERKNKNKDDQPLAQTPQILQGASTSR